MRLGRPFGQFVRHFINHLLALKYRNIPLNWVFSSNHDGLASDTLYEILAPLQRFYPDVFSAVTFPVVLGRFSNGNREFSRESSSTREAAFVLKMLFRTLRRAMEKAIPKQRLSRWSSYSGGHQTYSATEKEKKFQWVAKVIERIDPSRVLDIGCNDGKFSELASQRGAEVVAIDSDVSCVDTLWKKRLPRVLPMVTNIANPSSGMGWANQSRVGFLDRCKGKFDLVMALAVLHHLQIEGIPMVRILESLRDLTTRHLLLEFVGPEDEAWSLLPVNRFVVKLDQSSFETLLHSHFDIEAVQEVKSSRRWIYCLRRRESKVSA